ncbi:MAG: cell division protein FtsZ [Ignavibacteria bacterium]|nr:cell division protein FtsZ [Ignavibacteria bacterium]
MFQNRLDREENQLRKFSILIDREELPLAKIRVIGIGGGGCNAIDSMIRRGLQGVDFIAINTDQQALERSLAPRKIQIGKNITKGLGAGGDVIVGQKAMEEDRDKIAEAISNSDMVFIATGLGGGTGTGGAPILASIARSSGALVVGIVTKPFKWEGIPRQQKAEKGLAILKDHVDSLIVVPNERLLAISDSKTSFFEMYDKPNEVLYDATKGISDVIIKPGIQNIDFADIRAAMRQGGDTLMGCGRAKGEHKAVEAAQRAITSPLLEGLDIRGSRNVLVNIIASKNFTMPEAQAAMTFINDAAGENADVKFGIVNDESFEDEVMITVIATGYNKTNKLAPDTNVINIVSKKPVSTPITISPMKEDGFVKEYGPEKLPELDKPTYQRAKQSAESDTLFPKAENEEPQFTENLKSIKEENEEPSEQSLLLRKMMD